jgi:hypothetical protein
MSRGKPPSSLSVAATSTLSPSIVQTGVVIDESPLSGDSPQEDSEQEESPADDRANSESGDAGEQRDRKAWSPLLSLLFGILGLALSPAFGLGLMPAAVGIVAGHRARRLPAGRIRSGFGLALSYLALLISSGVAVLVATPLVRGLLISGGFLLP